MSETRTDRSPQWRVALLLLVAALAVRLALLPLTTLDTSDSAVRIWLGWLWADDPFLITSGLWGPGHFYLIGAAMRFWADTVWAPLALHVAIGSLVPIVVWRLTLELFASRRAAIACGLIFAFYPAAIAVSLGARAETPFMLFLGLGLIGLVRAWRPDGRVSHALFAGIAVTLASSLRYEAWLLLPFLTLPLIRKPRLAAAFLAAAMIHPAIWMIGNAVAYGNPLYSLLATSTWMQDVLAHEPDTGLVAGLLRVLRLVVRTAVEMTLPVALLVAAGAIQCVRIKRAESVWLAPAAALFVLFAISAFRDTMPIKAGYTTTFGLLLIPFIACAFEWLRIESWSRTRCAAIAISLSAAMALFVLEPVMSRLPAGSTLSASPIPTIPDDGSVRKLQALIERAGPMREQDALVSDSFGADATAYVAWQTRVHPQKICRAPGAPNVNVSAEELEVFLLANRSGVLITRPASRLTAHLTLESDQAASLAGIPIRLDPAGSLDWQSADPGRQFGTLTVSRYQVIGTDRVAPRAPLPCPSRCPLAHCR